MKTYPICLVQLEDQNMVVIGGGSVAARKAAVLLDTGAKLTVISPNISDAFYSLAKDYANLRLIERPYRDGDLEGVSLAIVATDVPETNQAVWQEAKRRGCLVNVVDDPLHSNFIVPAVLQRGELKIAVSTGGASPALARRMKERLEQIIEPEYSELTALLAELRPELIARFPPGKARLDVALCLVDADLLDILHQQGVDAARERARQIIESVAL